MMKNKLVILTGGSKGIGHVTLQKFVKEGWHSINLSRTASDINQVTNIAVDFSNPDWQKKIPEKLIQQCQNADQICLVNNAGVCQNDTIQSLTLQGLELHLQVNVVVPAMLTNLLLPYFKPGSSVIFLGSTLSEKAVPYNLSYVTAKHAVLGLMRAICQDLAGTMIYACCICPGVTDTEMLRDRCQHQPEILEILKNLSSPKRLIAPEEIAEVIWFCSNNPVINGSVIHANLGQIER